MRYAFAYFAFLFSGVLFVWFVAAWIDGIWRDGISQTAFTLFHWPAVTLTIALPIMGTVFLSLGASLLNKRE